MAAPDYQWFVQHWQDSAHVQLLDGYGRDAFIQRVRQRADDVGRTDHHTLIGHCLYRALYEPQRFGAMTTILDDIQAPAARVPQPVAGRPIDGPLRFDRRAACDDAGAFPALGFSAFWLPWAFEHNFDQFERFCEYAAGAGATYVRWFGSHDWSGGTNPRTHPRYWDLMEKTIQGLAEYRLRSQITLATRRHLIDDLFSFARGWHAIVARHMDKVILVEMVNEADHADNGWSVEDLHTLGYNFRDSPARYALTAPLGGPFVEMAETSTAHYQHPMGYTVDNDVRTFHFARKNTTAEGDWRPIRQPWHARFLPSSMAVINNEPRKWATTREQSVEWAAVAPIVSWIAGCGCHCHHDQVGVFNNQGHYPDVEGATQLAQVWGSVLPLLPGDLANWSPCRVGETPERHPFPRLIDHHWPFENIRHGVSRAFAAVRDTRFVMALTGVRDHVPLDDVQPDPFQVYSLLTGACVYDGCGPVTLRDAQAFLVVRL